MNPEYLASTEAVSALEVLLKEHDAKPSPDDDDLSTIQRPWHVGRYGKWRMVWCDDFYHQLDGHFDPVSAYYRTTETLDGFTITDMGEGARALRIMSGVVHRPIEEYGKAVQNPQILFSRDALLTICKPRHLARWLCCMMLSSYNVGRIGQEGGK